MLLVALLLMQAQPPRGEAFAQQQQEPSLLYKIYLRRPITLAAAYGPSNYGRSAPELRLRLFGLEVHAINTYDGVNDAGVAVHDEAAALMGISPISLSTEGGLTWLEPFALFFEGGHKEFTGGRTNDWNSTGWRFGTRVSYSLALGLGFAVRLGIEAAMQSISYSPAGAAAGTPDKAGSWSPAVFGFAGLGLDLSP